MSDLAAIGNALPPTQMEIVEALARAQDVIMSLPQVEMPTEHVIHGGMYARTIRLEPGVVIIGALIKVPTIVIVDGHSKVFIGDGWAEVTGYNVFAASAGRKQIFVALSPVKITMLFPTQAKTVEDAEKEFTDEWAQLVSVRDGANDIVNITGE